LTESDIGAVLVDGVVSAATYYALYAIISSLYGGLWAGLLIVVVSVVGFLQEGSDAIRATSVGAFVIALVALAWDVYLTLIL
jgi:hypothetical protein